MSNEHLVPVPDEFKKSCHLTDDQYQEMYQRSIADPEAFWSEQAASFIDWFVEPSTVRSADMRSGDVSWFADGVLNISYNCIDRHLPDKAQSTAIIWEGDDPTQDKKISYQELHDEVCKLANGLRARGVSKGDRVCIYMPMVPEAAFAMLACMRIGAIHSVVFGGFSPQSLKDRILDSDCRCVITADQGVRGGREIPLKENTEVALERRARCLVSRAGVRPTHQLRTRTHEGRRPVIHSLHLRLHR